MSDFAVVSANLLCEIHALVSSWLPGGRIQGDEYCCGGIAGGPGQSFKVNLTTGKWAEFAGDLKGGDLVSLYAAIHGITQLDSLKKLGGDSIRVLPSPRKTTTASKSTLITRRAPVLPPDDCVVPSMTHPALGSPSCFWLYKTAEGKPWFYVARYDTPTNDTPDGKEFLPWSWNGERWVAKGIPEPRPLYNLDHLTALPARPVLIVEGEKAADAASRWAGPYVVTTWPNGSASVKKADWSVLRGRSVLVWPDADKAGAKAAETLLPILHELGCTIKVINTEGLADGYDAADCSTWSTYGEFAEFAKPRATAWQPVLNEEPEPIPFSLEPGAVNYDPAPEPVEDNFDAAEVCATGIKGAPALAIFRLAQSVLNDEFKMLKRYSAPFVYAVTNQKKRQVDFCTNDDFLYQTAAKNLASEHGYYDTPMNIRKLVDIWKLAEPSLTEEPSQFGWSENSEWTLKRLSFTPSPGEYPAWNEFLARLSARDEFMAFIWSIFEMKNRSRQFLYLYDPAGQGGKSTVIGVLSELLGESACSLNNQMVSGGGNRWLMGSLYGRRLVTWADCKNPKFCMSETLRNITSGDAVPVERKNQDTFMAPIYLKLIIGSNSEPEITSAGADESRLIRVNVEENDVNKNDPEWRKGLVAQLPHFLDACRSMYALICPNHGDIIMSEQAMEDVRGSASAEDKFEEIATSRITFEPTAETSATEWKILCHEERLSDYEIGAFKAYLKRVWKVSQHRTAKLGVTRPRMYKGMRVKNRTIDTDSLPFN